MSRSLITLLLKPDVFFRDLISEQQSLDIPAWFVLIGGLLGAIGAYLMAGLTGKMLGGLMQGMESLLGIFAVVSAVIGAFLFWVVIAGIFFLISSLFKGKGKFGRCLEVVGYGYLPQVGSALVVTVLTVIFLPDISVASLPASALQDPQALQAAMGAFAHEPAMVHLRQVSAVVSIIFLLWSGYIWVCGIKAARGLSLRDAAICVGVPVGLYVIYLVYSVTLGMG